MQPARVRVIDIARRANVSRAAAARVLLGTGAGVIRVSEEKSKQILKLADEMHFQPDSTARMLAGKSSKTIGVLIDSYAPPVRFKTLSVAEKIMARDGYRFIIGQTHNNYHIFQSYISDFVSRRVEAIACLSHEYSDFDISRDCANLRNVVFLNRPKFANASHIEIDICTGVEKIVAHLYQSGRRRIGLLNSSSQSFSSKSRESGYRNGLSSHGLTFDNRLVYNFSISSPPDEECLKGINYLVKEEKVEAVIAYNDIWAVKLIKAMKKQGLLVPADVAVTGIDNIEIAELFEPALTTIDQNCEYQGKVLVEMILKMLSNKGEPTFERVVVEPELIIRESS